MQDNDIALISIGELGGFALQIILLCKELGSQGNG